MSGYCDCSCPTCFEIAIRSDGDEITLCNLCEEAGCDGESECSVDPDDAWGHGDTCCCPPCQDKM